MESVESDLAELDSCRQKHDGPVACRGLNAVDNDMLCRKSVLNLKQVDSTLGTRNDAVPD